MFDTSTPSDKHQILTETPAHHDLIGGSEFHVSTGRWITNSPEYPASIDMDHAGDKSLYGEVIGALSQAGDRVVKNLGDIAGGNATLGQMAEVVGEMAALGAGTAVVVLTAPEVAAGVGVGAAVLTAETAAAAGLGAVVGGAIGALPIVEGKVLDWWYGK